MLDLYLIGYAIFFALSLYIKRGGVGTAAFVPKYPALALSLFFVSLLLLLSAVTFFLETIGVWFCWGPASVWRIQSVRGLGVQNWPASFNFQRAILVSGAVTSTVFVLLLAAKPKFLLQNALTATCFLAAVSFVFVTTDSLPAFFVCFELLLLTSLYLLRLTSKSERVVEASVEMFFWTLFGSAALLVVFARLFAEHVVTFSALEAFSVPSPITACLLLVGFGVKIPLWPFFSWLLKAHVEASVEFSILLSGFIVKLGVFALYKTLLIFSAAWAPHILFSLSLLGLSSACMRLFSQRDLKRVVALTTVVEMNWLGLCLALGGHVFNNLAAYIVVVHSLTTALEFALVEGVSRRYGTRDAGTVSGIFAATPNLGLLSFLVVLVTIGFPGTPLFTAKFFFFAELCPLSWALSAVLAFILLLALPLFFVRLWAPLWFGLPQTPRSAHDLTSTEIPVFAALLAASFLLALCPQLLNCL